MGEAVYYAKVWFKSEKAAEAALPKVQEFFKEGSEAEDWWQGHRHEVPRLFWPPFEEKFPMVSKYLKHSGRFGKDCNNDLAGQLDFGCQADVEYQMMVVGNAIQYNAMVWHFADWEPLLDFVVEEFGGLKHKWLSDEYTDMFEMLK